MPEGIVEPLDWVEDLLAWKEPDIPSGNLPLTNYKKDKLATNEREILICHDMRGGYLPQEQDGGFLVPENENPYVFLNWWNIDIFCYFSHHFITIPPAGYVNAAHKHGCLVMGTFITEWKPGVDKCNKLFEDPETVEKVVKQLVDIAAYYRFDGWLINIENELKAEQLPTLANFLELLTIMMRTREGQRTSRVIWYDSVIVNGKLIWQNQLNLLNKHFYDCCDGIYLNYNWTDEMLLNSADHGLLSRIFVGIDVFGRGCSGGWDCYKPFSRAALIRMSLALFAPGWVAEKFPKEDPIGLNLKFWRKVREYTTSRPITQLPLETDFSAGFSQKEEGKWFCLNDVAIQPHFGGKEFRPLETGGLLIRQEGIHRIFNFDLDDRPLTITIKSSFPITVLLNGTPAPLSSPEDDKVTATVHISLKTVDIVTRCNDTVIQSVYIY